MHCVKDINNILDCHRKFFNYVGLCINDNNIQLTFMNNMSSVKHDNLQIYKCEDIGFSVGGDIFVMNRNDAYFYLDSNTQGYDCIENLRECIKSIIYTDDDILCEKYLMILKSYKLKEGLYKCTKRMYDLVTYNSTIIIFTKEENLLLNNKECKK